MNSFRKLLSLLIVLVIIGTGSITAFATTDYNGITFEYSRENLTNEITQRIKNGETNFVVERTFATGESDLCNDISIEINVINSLTRSASDTVNWSLTGRYYFASSDETVSNYGNRGSADCSGTGVSYEQWDAYHTVTYKYRNTYEARCSKSTSEMSDEDHGDGIKFNAAFRLKNSTTGNWADNSSIYIIVYEDGYWRSHGNYSSINVN